MNNYTLPKTDAAIAFVESFSNVKRLIGVYDIIAMCNGEFRMNTNRISLFDENGNIKSSLASQDLIHAGLEGEQLKWIDFILSNSRIHFDQMMIELDAWLVFNPGESHLLNHLELTMQRLSESLSHKELLSVIVSYNKELKNSKIKGKSELSLPTELANDCVRVIEILLNEFQDYVDSFAKKVKAEVIKPSEKARRGVIVKHRLRWNEDYESFEKLFIPLIRDESIILSSSQGGEKEIMDILNTVFERISMEQESKENLVKGKFPLSRLEFTIPERLIWTKSPAVFQEKFMLNVQDHVIFIENFERNSEGEAKEISIIMDQLFLINKVRGKGPLKASSLYSLLKR